MTLSALEVVRELGSGSSGVVKARRPTPIAAFLRTALNTAPSLSPASSSPTSPPQLVRHKRTSERYAMKVIPLGCSEEERRRILFEARTLHASAVVGIIAFRDAFCPPRCRRDVRRVGVCPPSRAARRRALTWRASCADAEGAVHMVLEYMDCGSLADVLARHGPLPERLLAHILKALIGGLVHLHRELKVVHRDIKPSNILLNQAGQAKLADFGMSGQLATVHSRLASWVGTAAYMSPERISGAKHSYEARHLGCISDVSRVDLRRTSG